MFEGMGEQEVLWQTQHLSSDTLLHVFQFLNSRDACRASTVCKAWHRAVERLDWESRYKRLWGPPPRVHATSLRAAFSERMCRARALTLRAPRCGEQGHPREIKCVALLASASVVVTGSYDGTMTAWELPSGVRLCKPQGHNATVRALAIDEDWCVSGSTDGKVSLWVRPPGAQPGRYDFETRRQQLAIHKGPVSCLCLTEDFLYSGSWDGSIMEISRSDCSMRRAFYLGDWVTAMSLSLGSRLLIAAGDRVICAAINGPEGNNRGKQLANEEYRASLPHQKAGLPHEIFDARHHQGTAVTALTSCPSGRFAFYGDDQGSVWVLDMMRCPAHSRQLSWTCAGVSDRCPIASLSYQFPWLVVTARGETFTVNVSRDLGLERECPLRGASISRVLGTLHCRAATLDDGWVAAADGACLDVFDFGRAAAAEAARAKARLARQEARSRRLARAAAAVAAARERRRQESVAVWDGVATGCAFETGLDDTWSGRCPDVEVQHNNSTTTLEVVPVDSLSNEADPEEPSDSNSHSRLPSRSRSPSTQRGRGPSAQLIATCRTQAARSMMLRKARSQVEALLWDQD